MHEWALAESVIMAVIDQVEKNGLKTVTEVVIGVGELQQVDLEIFQFGLDTLLKASEPQVAIGSIRIETEKSLLGCRACGAEWGLGDKTDKMDYIEKEAIHFLPEIAHAYMGCPECGSPDFEVRAGRGVTIKSIEGET